MLQALPKVRTTKLSPVGGTGKSISVVIWVPAAAFPPDAPQAEAHAPPLRCWTPALPAMKPVFTQ